MLTKLVNAAKSGKQVISSVDTPDIDIKAELKSLSPDQKYFVKKYERLNKDRYANFHRSHIMYGRKRGLLLGVWVLSIYCYTLYAMKQERFLDDIPDDVPASESSDAAPAAPSGT